MVATARSWGSWYGSGSFDSSDSSLTVEMDEASSLNSLGLLDEA
jgi:hypothetical protein